MEDMNCEGSRWQEIRSIHSEFRYFYRVLFGLTIVLFATWLGSVVFATEESYWSNVYMTGLGVLITVLVLNQLSEQREEQRRTRELQQLLVRQLGSRINDIALYAAEELKNHNWHSSGVLQDAMLRRANLRGADLRDANLERAFLKGAKLAGAHLEGANLDKANLEWANLSDAFLQNASICNARLFSTVFDKSDLRGVNFDGAVFTGSRFVGANLEWNNLSGLNLQGVDFSGANMQHTDLAGANLIGADLSDANLEGADLTGAILSGVVSGETFSAIFSDDTRLPDRSLWTADSVLERFTDLNRPDYFRVKDSRSNAKSAGYSEAEKHIESHWDEWMWE